MKDNHGDMTHRYSNGDPLGSGLATSQIRSDHEDESSSVNNGTIIKRSPSVDPPGHHDDVSDHDNVSPDHNDFSIETLVEELRAPEEFFDPLNEHLMKDPVVLSTGYCVDRDTALDKDGILSFKRCPFTGKGLNPTVYPLEEKKEKIESFRLKRDQNVTKIVRKLISDKNEKYESFQNILDDVKSYLKHKGENYFSITRELSEIWSGAAISLPSTTLLVEHLKIKGSNSWTTAVESDPIEHDIYKILVSAEIFKDKAKGSHRSFLALSLYDHEEKLVDRCKLFKDPHYGKGNPYCTFGKKDTIVANARVGYTYKLEYFVGSSPRYVQVEGLICKIFPTIEYVSSFRMRDADGEEGLFIGQLDAKRNADGQGSLEYDDGKRFVGSFKHGAMLEGVLYRGPVIRYTLKRGKWTRSIDDELVEKYPPNIIVYDESGCLYKPKMKKRFEATDKKETVDEARHRRYNHTVHDDYRTSIEEKYNGKPVARDVAIEEKYYGKPVARDVDEPSRAPRYNRRAFVDDSSDDAFEFRPRDKIREGEKLYQYYDSKNKRSLQGSPNSRLYRESDHYDIEERDVRSSRYYDPHA